jgi:hypothetical protein
MSTNGKATDAEIAAILSGGREQIDRYLVTCAIGTKRVLDDLPESIAGAVADSIAACRADTGEQREKLDALWTARTEARGVHRFWTTMGKVLAAACAFAGLIVTLASLIT